MGQTAIRTSGRGKKQLCGCLLPLAGCHLHLLFACANLGWPSTGPQPPPGSRPQVLWVHLSPRPLTALGAAYGTAKSGTGIAAMSVMRPELIMKSIIPVVMAGIIAIYGLVVAVLIANSLNDDISLYRSVLGPSPHALPSLPRVRPPYRTGRAGEGAWPVTHACPASS